KAMLWVKMKMAAAVLLVTTAVATVAAVPLVARSEHTRPGPEVTKGDGQPPVPVELKGNLVLDDTVYFRHYFQLDWDVISPEPLKADGDKLLGKNVVTRLEREVKQRLDHLKIDWKTTDWRDKAVVRFACPNAGIRAVPESEQYMNSPAAPAGW